MKDNDEWKEWTGIGVCFFLLCMGIGGCQLLVKKADAEKLRYQQEAIPAP